MSKDRCDLCQEYVSNRRNVNLSKEDIETLLTPGGTVRGLSRSGWRRYLQHGMDICNKCNKDKAQYYIDGYGKDDNQWYKQLQQKEIDISKCSVDTLLSGDPLKDLEDENLVVFIHPKGEEVECYGYDELYKWWRDASRLYYWPLKDKRVYKLAYTGIWVDQTVYNLVIDDKKHVILLHEKEKHAIGSSFGVSQTHGEVHAIYSGKSVDPRNLKYLKSKTSEIIEEEELEFPIPDETYSDIDDIDDGIISNSEEEYISDVEE